MKLEEILYKLEEIRKVQEEIEECVSIIKPKEDDDKYKLNSLQYKVIRSGAMIQTLINNLSNDLVEEEPKEVITND